VIPVWAWLSMAAGGLIYVALWPVFTSLHGPTSFNEDRELLGGDAQLWGAMMEGPSGLLVAAGLVGSYAFLVAERGRGARIGFWLAMVGLVMPSVVSIVIRETVPPLLAPLLAVGLVLMAFANGEASTVSLRHRFLLAALGCAQAFAFLWALLVRPDLMDRIDGYRIYGIAANVIFGVTWIMLAASLAVCGGGALRTRRRH
jgi:hypothetical protein